MIWPKKPSEILRHAAKHRGEFVWNTDAGKEVYALMHFHEGHIEEGLRILGYNLPARIAGAQQSLSKLSYGGDKVNDAWLALAYDLEKEGL